jgi:hypothetical protein
MYPTVMCCLKGLNIVDVSLPSPEDGEFMKLVFSSYLEYSTMEKVQKPSNSEHYTSFLVDLTNWDVEMWTEFNYSVQGPMT